MLSEILLQGRANRVLIALAGAAMARDLAPSTVRRH